MQLHALGLLCGLMPQENELNYDSVVVTNILSGISPIPFEGTSTCTTYMYVHACTVLSRIAAVSFRRRVSFNAGGHKSCTVINAGSRIIAGGVSLERAPA